MPMRRASGLRLLPTCLVLAAGLVAAPLTSGQAASITGLGIENFLENGQRSGLGTGLSAMADTVLSGIMSDPLYKDCKVQQVEVKREAERQRELQLGQTPGLVDPATRVTDRTIPLGHRITGSVIESAEGGSYRLSLENAKTGEVIATVQGGGKDIAELEASLRETLRNLLDQLCPRVHVLKASTGPYFQIETEICGFDRPFQVRPKGEFRGVQMVFTPQSGTAGTFTQGGRAYGTLWTGGGTYTVTWNGDTGRFVARDSYVARNQAGQSNNPNDQMTGTVKRLPKTCTR